MNRVYTYKVRLRKGHHDRLDDLFLHLGWLRNKAVEHGMKMWGAKQKTPSKYDMYKQVAKTLRLQTQSEIESETGRGVPFEHAPKHYYSVAQQSVVQRVGMAFERKKKGVGNAGRKGKGWPNYRPIATGVQSFDVPIISGRPPVRKGKSGWFMPIKNVGNIAFRDPHGRLEGVKIKTARLVRTQVGSKIGHYDRETNDGAKRQAKVRTGYRVQVICELPDTVTVAPDKVVGVDVGGRERGKNPNRGAWYDGEKGGELPAHSRNRNKIKKRQQALSSKRGSRKTESGQTKGSNKWVKAKMELARLHERETTAAKQATHRMTTDIAKMGSVIVHEDLSVQKMTRKGGSRKRGMNRAFLAQSPSMVFAQLEYKAKEVAKVNPAYTSQDCSVCGHRNGVGSKTKYTCESCGNVDHRDINAAKNIRAAYVRSSTPVLPGSLTHQVSGTEEDQAHKTLPKRRAPQGERQIKESNAYGQGTPSSKPAISVKRERSQNGANRNATL